MRLKKSKVRIKGFRSPYGSAPTQLALHHIPVCFWGPDPDCSITPAHPAPDRTNDLTGMVCSVLPGSPGTDLSLWDTGLETGNPE